MVGEYAVDLLVEQMVKHADVRRHELLGDQREALVRMPEIRIAHACEQIFLGGDRHEFQPRGDDVRLKIRISDERHTMPAIVQAPKRASFVERVRVPVAVKAVRPAFVQYVRVARTTPIRRCSSAPCSA